MKFKISNHIALQVKDYKKAIAHYRDVMGMEIVSQGKNYAEVKAGDTIFHLEGNEKGGETFFDFEVDDIEKSRVLLEKQGAKFSDATSDQGKSYLVRDPFGMNFLMYQNRDLCE